MPMRNTGADTPNSARPIAARTCRLRGRRTARIPVANPSGSQSTQPPSASEAVTGTRSRIVCNTGRWSWNE
jgi:hypothetical protein